MSHALQDDVPDNGLSFRSMSICSEIKNDATPTESVKELPEPTEDLGLPSSDDTPKDNEYLMLHAPPDYLHGKDNDDAETNLPQSLPLQLRTLNSTADLDHVLSQFADRLDGDFDGSAINFQPQFALMELPKSDGPSNSTQDDAKAGPVESVPAIERDLANPLEVDDYSVHGEQVNC